MLAEELGRLEVCTTDAIVVTTLQNVRYLSGFTGSNAILLLRGKEMTLYTDPRYAIQAVQESTAKVKVVRGELIAALKAPLAKCKAIGFENRRIGFAAAASLQKLLKPGAVLIGIEDAIEQKRIVKTAEEIALIRESVRINSLAFERGLKRFRHGMTESNLAAEFDYQQRKLGAEKPAFDTIVASAERSALPHAHPTEETIPPNGLLLVDMGSFRRGYASDMTRTVHLGRAGAKVRTLYHAVLEAQLAAIDAVKPGVTTGRVDRAARAVLAKFGFEKAFVHSTGHGLGLEIHEPPRIGKRDKTRLTAGMAITIEPGVYLEGLGGIRIEDTVLVTANGCEILTPTPKEFTVL
jgi:Xaa-Pro aminopeptidase